jgi:hypothetical protein
MWYVRDDFDTGSFVRWMLWSLGKYDEITYLYCIVPGIVLSGLVIHKSIWPLMARITYLLLDYKVLTDRKYLIPIGAMALGIAFGLATFKEMLEKYLKP